MVVCENPRAPQTSSSAINNHATFKVTYIPFLPYSDATSRLHHVCIPKCIELLPCDWLIRNLCYQAIEQVYLIKWPVSVYCLCHYIPDNTIVTQECNLCVATNQIFV